MQCNDTSYFCFISISVLAASSALGWEFEEG